MSDPLMPPSPREIFFDSHRGMWVLSRYADVLAAMREPALRPVSAKKSKNLKVPDASALRDLRARVLDASSPASLALYQAQMEQAADSLPRGGLDLIGDFAEPLCLAAAATITGAKREDLARLVDLARTVSRAAAEPFDEDLRLAATNADAELEKYFTNAPIPMAGSTFVALSQTTLCMLANGWLAMFRHPDELAHVRVQIPRAVEEILRYACIPQLVFRYVPEPLSLCGQPLPEGARLMLHLASANRDPARFFEPDRFCSARENVSHLALGFGPHACVGGALIRMVAATATRLFVGRFAAAELAGPVEWQGGAGFRSVSALYIR
jgi:cytochrome P450